MLELIKYRGDESLPCIFYISDSSSANGSQINLVKDMKNSILKVAEHLENGTIDSDKARSLLLNLFGVSGSLLSKTYEIDFGGNLKCKIRVCGSELEVEAAMNGWGNGIPCSEISVVEVQ